MKHTIILALLAAVYSASLQPGFATSKDNKGEESVAMLERAAELSNLRSQENPSFRLRARVQFLGISKERVHGSYLLVWASPQRWREEITFPGFDQVRVVQDGKLWHRRNLSHLPLRIYQLTEMFNFQSRLKLKPQEKVGKVEQRTWNGTQARCVKVRPKGKRAYELCFDPAGGSLVREESQIVTYEYRHYMSLENKVFPRTLRAIEEQKPVVEVWVEELVATRAPDLSFFSPPSGAEVQVWCESPEPAQLLREGSSLETYYFVNGPMQGVVSVYAVIGEDGKLHDLTLIRPVLPEMGDVMLDMLTRRRYRPKMCNGIPVKDETVIEVRFRGP